MDFAALMQAQISKAKGGANTDGRKYVKKGEVEAAREAAYRAEQQQKEAEKEGRLAKKRKAEEDEAERDRQREERRDQLAEESRKAREAQEEQLARAHRRRLGLPDPPPKEAENLEDASNDRTVAMSDEELFSKLREISAPITLFGETSSRRQKRFERLSTELAHAKATKGQIIPTTLTLLPESEMKVPATVPNKPEDVAFLYQQLASYFSLVLREWRIALAQRPAEVKESHQGQVAAMALDQCVINFKPLFRRFEANDLERGILNPMVDIVKAAQERRYVDGSNAYLKLSIGNEAWPIGVTMVGIHERSAQENLKEGSKGKKQAHIMSDEVTRKFLQSIKRCLTFAQTRWPPEDQLQLMG